ncbi:MAG: class I SAM-dependent methyltransferase [Dehalococcoidia bacterium]
MLNHDNLEDFQDAEHYDIHENDTGVAFYTALAQETGGPVLELACGTGRVGIPIARLGLAVTGLDIVPGMLEQARRKSRGLSIRWVEGDARAFALGEQFRLIFLTGNAFQMLLTNADQAALLERVRAHLHDEGLFAFETRNPLWAGLLTRAGQETILEHARRRGDFVTFLEDREEEKAGIDALGREVWETLAQMYDPVTQILHLTNHKRWREGEQERTKVTRLALRYTFPQELAALLHTNGFTIERQYGDWNLEPLTAASTSIIVVCRKRP